MSEINFQDDNFMAVLVGMEGRWQEAVAKAMAVREDQLRASHRAITTLQQQLRDQESSFKWKNEEVDSLRLNMNEMKKRLDLADKEKSRLMEIYERKLEEVMEEHSQQMEAKEKEIDDMKSKHRVTIQELTAEAKLTLQELEMQLEEASQRQAEYQKQLPEFESYKNYNEQCLQDWKRVYDKMGDEMSEVKEKLKSTQFANKKLREELGMWKKYCEKVEEEKKAIKRDIELENKVLKKFSQIDLFLKTERQHRNIVLDAMNRFKTNLVKDLKPLLEYSRPKTIRLMEVSSQTDNFNNADEWVEKKSMEEQVYALKQREMELEDVLKKCEVYMDNLTQQNNTLKEVIKSFKKEKENWEKEKEQIEEEARVSKLEENVRLLKTNFVNEQKDVNIWDALQDVKREVSSLKSRAAHKSLRLDSELLSPKKQNSAPVVAPLRSLLRNK